MRLVRIISIMLRDTEAKEFNILCVIVITRDNGS